MDLHFTNLEEKHELLPAVLHGLGVPQLNEHVAKEPKIGKV